MISHESVPYECIAADLIKEDGVSHARDEGP